MDKPPKLNRDIVETIFDAGFNTAVASAFMNDAASWEIREKAFHRMLEKYGLPKYTDGGR